MIQRIQSIYMLLVAIASGALIFVLPFGVSDDGSIIDITKEMILLIPFIASAVLALIAIFSFKNRQNQFVINRLNMILNLFLLGVFVYRSLNTAGGFHPEKAVGMFLPIVSIVLLVLANKAIKKDEDLVKSVDRLR